MTGHAQLLVRPKFILRLRRDGGAAAGSGAAQPS
jgi:hypothetical protein